MKSSDAKKQLLQNSELKAEYESVNIARDVARSVIVARSKAELSQAQLADLIGTKQPSIARIESGEILPSLTFLIRISNALGTELTAPELVQPKPTIELVSEDSVTAAHTEVRTDTLIPNYFAEAVNAFNLIPLELAYA